MSAWLLLVIAFATWGLNWARRSLVVRAVGDVVLELRSRAFEAAAEHDLSFYDQFSSGRIVSRITSDSNDFGQLVVIVTDLGSQVFQAIILGVVLVRTEWHLALLLFSFVPFIFGITIGFRSLARRVTRRGMQAMADVNAAIKETVSGISIAKNFRQEETIFTIFDAANQQSYRRQHPARLGAFAGLPGAQCGRRHLHRHPGLRRRVEHCAGHRSRPAPGTCSS